MNITTGKIMHHVKSRPGGGESCVKNPAMGNNFQAVVVQKLKFLNNSNEILSITDSALEAAEIL
jgi:hypothetical protein